METSHLPEGYILRGTDHSYRIDGILGQGSFGITYFATTKAYVEGGLGRIETGIKVAVKEFFMQELCSRESDGRVLRQSEGSLVGEYARRFRTEAENLSRLSHPGIVKVLEVFETNGTCYYSMEYFDGGSLEAYVKRVGGLPEGEACGCIRQISQALAYMHSMKMLHLDLKPRNVVCSSDGSRLALIDFGLSKQYKADGLPEASTSIGLGTPGYAPLEQSGADREKDFAPTLDVYALGATYYKLLTGETPPDASSVLNYGLPKDKLIRRDVSESSVTAIERAMAPRKLDRLQSVRAFLELLDDKTVTYGTLRVSSMPDGAKVFVDGVQIGSTKSSLEIKLEPGTHIVRIEKGGYEAVERHVTITAGCASEIRAELARKQDRVTPPPPDKKSMPTLLKVVITIILIGVLIVCVVFLFDNNADKAKKYLAPLWFVIISPILKKIWD